MPWGKGVQFWQKKSIIVVRFSFVVDRFSKTIDDKRETTLFAIFAKSSL